MTYSTRHKFGQAKKLQNVSYDIRGKLAVEAERMEKAGEEILKLNTGNPAEFGFEAPEHIVKQMAADLPVAHGYSTSKGIDQAREAIVERYEPEDFPDFDVEDVYLGNGVSELITIVTQALLDEGDEILVPAPDYPLWTAASTLAGGTVVHYLCDEDDEWNPSIADIKAKVTDKTKAIVVINPNNPTGAVYSKETLEAIVEVARENDLIILADEIYDRILYDGAEHISIANLADDLVTVTFNGLSKAYRLAGYRAGWMIVTGPTEYAEGFIEGVDLLAGARLCPNVPAQHAIPAALGGHQSIFELTSESGRLHEQRDVAYEGLNAIPGISTVKARGALYTFPRLDPEVYDIQNDADLMLDILRKEKILLVQGTGFNYPDHNHFRVVTLPEASELKAAIERLGNFFADYRK